MSGLNNPLTQLMPAPSARLAALLLALPFAAAQPTGSCLTNTSTPCPPPSWKPQWNLTLSTIVNPGIPGWFEPLPSQPWGLVSLDWQSARSVSLFPTQLIKPFLSCILAALGPKAAPTWLPLTPPPPNSLLPSGVGPKRLHARHGGGHVAGGLPAHQGDLPWDPMLYLP